MKILFLRTPPYDLNPSTYNIQQIGLGSAFCRDGFDFDFVTFKKHNPKEWVFYENSGCRGKYIEKKRFKFLRWGINSEVISRKFLSQYDIIIVQEYYQLLTPIIAKRHPYVYCYSGPYWNLFFTKIGSFFYDKLFVGSMNHNLRRLFTKSDLANKFLKRKGFQKVLTLGVGFSPENYDNSTMDSKTKEVISFMQDHPCILFVGSLNKNKNIAFAIRVFQKILAKIPNARMVVVGREPHYGRLNPKRLSNCYGRSLRVLDKTEESKILHIQSIPNIQLQFVFKNAKCLLLPSIHEIFGMVLLEAAHFGCPVVASFNGGSSTFLSKKECMIVEEKFDAEAWSSDIQKIILDKNFASEISNKAKQVVDNEFSWDNIAKKMEDSFIQDGIKTDHR